MAIEIRRVQTPSDAEAVFRLRYEIYIEELNRVQRYVDHAQRTITEPLDVCGHVFGAYDGAQLVGTARINYVRNSELSEYSRLYAMDTVAGADPHTFSVTTKLLVAKEHRRSTVAFRLAVALYVTGLTDGIEHDFVDVYPPRVPFFERLGYRIHRPAVLHPEYGEVVVMHLRARDEAHLRAVESPFLPHLLRLSEVAA